MKDIKVIIIILLGIATASFGGLYIRELNRSCECSEKECEECPKKECDEEPKLVNSGEFQRTLIEEIEVEDGYELLGIATSQEEYKTLTKGLSFEVREYEYQEDLQTNCISTNGREVTNCISTKKQLEKDYDRYVYALVVLQIDECNVSLSYEGFYLDQYINLVFNEVTNCGVCAYSYYLYEIGIPRSYYNAQELDIEFIERESDKKCDPNIAYKPIMYIYPEKDIELNITFDKEDLLTTTYPKYENGWNVKVLKDGSIYKDNKYYYALYWESKYNHKVDFSEGFYVTKDNAINFLEEKLTLLGLNDKERNEFIMYWLPIIEQNEKNLIYFETTDSLNKNEQINFSIKPDSLIRIRMHIKKVDKEINIKEQQITKPNRTGFTVVEWGGVIY